MSCYMMLFVLRPPIILLYITWLCDSESDMYDNPVTDVTLLLHMILYHTFVQVQNNNNNNNNKLKNEKRNRIWLSPSFTTLTNEPLPFSNIYITNFIQIVSLQPVDWFLQTKLHWKALDYGYLYIYEMYKSNNRLLRYQTISNYKSYWLLSQEWLNRFL